MREIDLLKNDYSYSIEECVKKKKKKKKRKEKWKIHKKQIHKNVNISIQ